MLKFDATKLVKDVREAAGEILLVSAHDILEVSQQFCPVRTGALKASGRVEIERTADTRTAYIGYGNEEIDYAKYPEYGFHDRGGGFVPAQPYLTPAFAEAESIVEARAREILKELE